MIQSDQSHLSKDLLCIYAQFEKVTPEIMSCQILSLLAPSSSQGELGAAGS